MHRRLCALGLAAVLLCGLAIASHPAGAPEASAPRHEPAVMATRAHPAVTTLTTARNTRDRLTSLVAVLGALLLVGAATKRADRPLSGPRLFEVASTHAPSRAPPAPQNFAF